MLGMIFGVAAVIAMLSIGAGAQQKMIAFIEQLGVRNIIVEAREATDYQSLQKVRKLSAGLSFQDLRAIQANVEGLAGVERAQARRPDAGAAEAAGRGADDLRRLAGVPGRSRGLRDDARPLLQRRARTEAAAPSPCSGRRRPPRLFGVDDPIDQFVKINQQWFRVIGVAGPQLVAESDVGGLPAQDRNNVIYVPLMVGDPAARGFAELLQGRNRRAST